MTLMEYRFKHLVFDTHPMNPPEWDRPLCVIDQGIACNDDYLFKYNCYYNHSAKNKSKVLILNLQVRLLQINNFYILGT